MNSLPLTGLVTAFTCLLMLATGVNVAQARTRYSIKAPAVTGHEMFERAYRVQMNTLENAAIFLPALWLYAVFMGDRGAALLGASWVLARAWYAVAYHTNPASRGAPFTVSIIAFTGLWLGGLWGIIKVLMA